MNLFEKYNKVAFYDQSNLIEKLLKGRDEVIKWQWRLASPIVYLCVILLMSITALDIIITYPMSLFISLGEKFTNTIKEDNPKGNRWLIPPIFLSLVLTCPAIIWGLPKIILRHWRWRKREQELKEERNREAQRQMVVENLNHLDELSNSSAREMLRYRRVKRDTGSSYIDDMVTSNVRKHKL